MKIDFDHMEEQALAHFKGGEQVTYARIFNDKGARSMHGRLEPGTSIGLHTHEGSSEVVYVLSGTGTVLYDGEEIQVGPGDCHYCPEGHAHSLINTGTEELRIFAVVPLYE